ncbi:hypothetical protein ACWDBO_42215 [Streptomyces mirabilis]|uniref:hypothetical protein n=1 Tax=Streptomyces TaxID=1883 RepID=UPI0029A513D5|nr:hypothetical protein [Streptomyces sp. AK02-04a]MDX3762173.1 hypothetical protein [Streptomyces sp. AK02-04a]
MSPSTSHAVLAQVEDKGYELTKAQVIPITDDELRNLPLRFVRGNRFWLKFRDAGTVRSGVERRVWLDRRRVRAVRCR